MTAADLDALLTMLENHLTSLTIIIGGLGIAVYGALTRITMAWLAFRKATAALAATAALDHVTRAVEVATQAGSDAAMVKTLVAMGASDLPKNVNDALLSSVARIDPKTNSSGETKP